LTISSKTIGLLVILVYCKDRKIFDLTLVDGVDADDNASFEIVEMH
jgi:hypothetical protein